MSDHHSHASEGQLELWSDNVIPVKAATSLTWNPNCRFLRNLIIRKYQKLPNEKHSISFHGGGTIVYENVNITKRREKLRNCSRLQDLKEMRQLNAIQDTGLEKIG